MRRLLVSRPSGHSARAPTPVPIPRFAHALFADVLNRCDLWTLLECHAVGLAARSASDVRRVRAVFPELNQQVVGPPEPAEWQHLELRLHRAISDLAHNARLTAMLEDVCGELEAICARHIHQPIHRPGTLWLLQCQHRKILSCIETGRADEAMLHTRAHLHLIRDQLLAALNASALPVL